jgi:hypothetical protein
MGLGFGGLFMHSVGAGGLWYAIRNGVDLLSKFWAVKFT